MVGKSNYRRSRLKNLYGDRYEEFMARKKSKASTSGSEEKKSAAKVAAKHANAAPSRKSKRPQGEEPEGQEEGTRTRTVQTMPDEDKDL
ncbi:hypothetical protein BKA70DRAFT_1437893 [Coprinopsis sp. MPI-PUGE-AT-0042]|nr:hypothetical protein BKA70DRAFT_1437893 [Coprinopsis sp. MPI-PUGE-AT-0042]